MKEENSQICFKMARDGKEQADIEGNIGGRTVKVSEDTIECSCNLYYVEGIICRHVFSVFKVQQIKDLTKYLHIRWRIKLFKPKLLWMK